MPRAKQALMKPKVQVEFTPERKEEFLIHFRSNGFLAMSAGLVGVTERTVQLHREKDKAFDEQYCHAHRAYVEEVYVTPARKRATEGVRVPVIGGKDRDEIVTYVQEYSDPLLMMLLKAKLPEFNQSANPAGSGEGPGAAGGGGGGGVLVVCQAPHSIVDWEAMFGEKAKGETGKPSHV